MMSGAISSGIRRTVYMGSYTKLGMPNIVTIELVKLPGVLNSYKRLKRGSFLSTGVRSWESNLIIKMPIHALVATFARSAARVDEAESVVSSSR